MNRDLNIVTRRVDMNRMLAMLQLSTGINMLTLLQLYIGIYKLAFCSNRDVSIATTM